MPKRILIVDAEPGFTRMIKLGLERTGRYLVREENDAIEVLSALRQFDPDLVLLNGRLAPVRGSDLSIHLNWNELLNRVPVVLLSDRGVLQDADDERPSLSKPVLWPRLIRCIEEHTHRPQPALV